MVAEALDGRRFDGAAVSTRVLPVALKGFREHLRALLDELEPAVVVGLGLAPGEPVLRLERVGLNLADFGIPDNAGAVCRNHPLAPDSDGALFSSLPLRAIESALLAAGVPGRISNTAGTYLCNATLYYLLEAIGKRGWSCPCGFIHLPYLPHQAAGLMDGSLLGSEQESGSAEAPPSMSLGTMVDGVQLVIETSLAAAAPVETS